MKVVGIVLLTLLCAFGAICLEAWLVMLLWNWAIVGLFGAPTMGFWISFGVCLLISILFGGKTGISFNSN